MAAGVLAVLAGAQLIRWLNVEYEKRDATPDASTPSIEIVNAQSIILREDGRKIWEVSAKRITISPDRRYANAWQVSKGVLFRDGRPFMQLQAERVRINQLTRDLEATGIVKAHGPDGFSLRTTLARWQNQKKTLDCPQPVQATLRGVKLSSARASYNTAQRRLICPKPVRAVSRDTTFTARSATYDAPSSQLHCVGAVRLQSKNATLTGGDVRADTKRQTILLSGPVEIVAQPGAERALSELLPLPWPSPSPSPAKTAPSG